MNLVCPKHPDEVLFEGGLQLLTEMYVGEPISYCPQCGKSYFRSECVPEVAVEDE
jgi:hypothetical protein